MTGASILIPEPPGRVLPPAGPNERLALEAWLEFHRATLITKCAGLTAEELAARACPPSTLSLLGLLRHMTDVERGWFLRRWVADFSPRYSTQTDPDRCFDDVDPAHARADIDTYHAAVEECRAAAAHHDLDEQVPLRLGTKPGTLIDVRWIYLHMIEEYARHNGHADLLRQTIDGSTGW